MIRITVQTYHAYIILSIYSTQQRFYNPVGLTIEFIYVQCIFSQRTGTIFPLSIKVHIFGGELPTLGSGVYSLRADDISLRYSRVRIS